MVQTGLLAVVVLVMLWLALNVRVPSTESLRETVDGLGWAGWLGFIGLYALVALTPIPITIMAVAAGVLFGTILGSALSIPGVLLGSWGAYWLARGLGKTTVQRLLGHHAATVQLHLKSNGIQSVYLLRLMPGVPYWPVNYGSGVSGITQRDFLVASGLATIPGQVSLVAVGAFIAHPSVEKGTVVLLAWVVVLVMTWRAYGTWKATSRRRRPQ